MATVDGTVETLGQAILGEARAEIEQITARAQAEAEAIRQRSKETAARERQQILDEAAQQARRLRGQEAATAQMKARSLELEAREKLLAGVFAAAAERLASVTQQPDYASIAEALCREALTQLKSSSIELSMDKATRAVLDDRVLGEIAKDTGIELRTGKALGSGTGVIARTPDGRLQFDNTLETRLARMQSSIRAAVFKILVGEAE